MIRDIYLAGGARTALGAFCGALEGVPAPALGIAVTKAALARAGVAASAVDEIIFGNVIGAGLGQNIGRQIGLRAGLSPATSATTINKVCGSALSAVTLAARTVHCGDAQTVMVGGTENMSRAPYLLEHARRGYRRGNAELVDSLLRDGLWDVSNNLPMGMCAERCAAELRFTREEQDDFAVTSYERALSATAKGYSADEIVPIEVKIGKERASFAQDEPLKKFNEEKLRKLPPVFAEKGTITAGNASSLSDGAAGLVVLSRSRVDELQARPQARLAGYAACAGEPIRFTLAPILAIRQLLAKVGWQVADVDLFEINEAFAIVPLAAMRELGISIDKVNVLGGAIALGHPIGASGARILVTLLNALRIRGGQRGVAAICIGGGEGIALAVELC